MNPQRVGRALGIGLRVASRIVGARVAAANRPAQPQPASPRYAGSASIPGSAQPSQTQQAAQTAARIGRNAAQVSSAAARGAGGVLKPFKRVGGILWLEVTGTFFFLFALVFACYGWKSWQTHTMKSVELSVVVMAVFLYLGISSFYRASRR